MDVISDTPYFIGAILVLIGFFAGYSLSDIFSRRNKGNGDGGRRDSSAYLKGINYVLSNEPDKAIEAFSEAVQINSDTVETYIALGNLYRSKGELARAIRIHQSIIVRPNIDEKTKLQAYYDLSLDFQKAGFVERAINSYEEVVKMDSRYLDAYVHLLELYEDIKDWEKAYQTQLKISKLRKSDDSHILAHHQVELGKIYAEKGQNQQAKKAFNKAISLHGGCLDAYLHLGDILSLEENYSKAVATWTKVMELAPGFTYLAYPRLEEAYFKLNQFSEIEELLKANSSRNYNDIHTHLALAEYLYKKNLVDDAIAELRIVLELKPSHLKARRELARYLLEQGKETEAVAAYEAVFDNMPIQEKNFQCTNCGYETRTLAWRCPQCRSWDAISEKPLAGDRED